MPRTGKPSKNKKLSAAYNKSKSKFSETRLVKNFDKVKTFTGQHTQISDLTKAVAIQKNILAKYQAEIQFIKKSGIKGVEGILRAAKSLETEILAIKATVKGNTDTQATAQVKIKLVPDVKELLDGITILMNANLISKNDFKLAATLDKELGDMSVKFQSSLSGLANLDASLSATAKLFDLRNGSLVSLLLSASAGFDLGLAICAKGELLPGDKLKLTAAITGEVTVTGLARLGGAAKLSINQVVLAFNASAKSTAIATVKTVVGAFTIGGLGLELEAGTKAMALAAAAAQVEFTLDLKNKEIAFGGKAAAGAEAGIFGFLAGSLKCKEAVLIKSEFTTGVTAGVGGIAGANFKVIGGKLTIFVDLGATLDAGAASQLKIEVDFGTIDTLIRNKVKEEYRLWKNISYNKKTKEIHLKEEEETYKLLEDLNIKKLKFDLMLETARVRDQIIPLRKHLHNEEKGIGLLEVAIKNGLEKQATSLGKEYKTLLTLLSIDSKIGTVIRKSISESIKEQLSNYEVEIDATTLKITSTKGWRNIPLDKAELNIQRSLNSFGTNKIKETLKKTIDAKCSAILKLRLEHKETNEQEALSIFQSAIKRGLKEVAELNEITLDALIEFLEIDSPISEKISKIISTIINKAIPGYKVTVNRTPLEIIPIKGWLDTPLDEQDREVIKRLESQGVVSLLEGYMEQTIKSQFGQILILKKQNKKEDEQEAIQLLHSAIESVLTDVAEKNIKVEYPLLLKALYGKSDIRKEIGKEISKAIRTIIPGYRVTINMATLEITSTKGWKTFPKIEKDDVKKVLRALTIALVTARQDIHNAQLRNSLENETKGLKILETAIKKGLKGDISEEKHEALLQLDSNSPIIKKISKDILYQIKDSCVPGYKVSIDMRTLKVTPIKGWLKAK